MTPELRKNRHRLGELLLPGNEERLLLFLSEAYSAEAFWPVMHRALCFTIHFPSQL